MTDKISDALIDEMLAGLEGVTPGPWHEGDKWVFVSPRSGRGGDALEDILRNEEGPHNVAHIARCSPETIRALLLELRSYRTASNPLQSVADGVAAAQKRIEELGLVGFPLIDSMSDEEFAADRSGENPNAGTPKPVSEITEEWIRDTAMNVMLATEVDEAVRILTAAMGGE